MGQSGYTCVRYIFCYLNILLWLSGCGILGVGIWLHVSHSGYTTLLPQYALIGADVLLITLGVIMFVVTFFGCCGSWFQSRCMLVTYFGLVIFLFLTEFMFATLAFVFREQLGDTLKDELMLGIREHYMNPPDNGLEVIWDHIHNEFHCCGVTGYEDWFYIKAWQQRRVPDSCCIPKYQNVTNCGNVDEEHYDPESMWYMKGCAEQVQMWFVRRLHVVGIVGLIVSFIQGCAEQVQMWFVRRLHVVGIVGLIVSFIQLFGLISSMLLFCTVRHKRTSHTYKSYDTTS